MKKIFSIIALSLTLSFSCQNADAQVSKVFGGLFHKGSKGTLPENVQSNDQDDWRGGYSELQDEPSKKDFHPLGYRGMVYYTTDVEGSKKDKFKDIMTIHGLQVTERVFVGAGIAFNAGGDPVRDYRDYVNGHVNLFADFRYGFNDHRWCPYFDLQIGGRFNKSKNGNYRGTNYEAKAKNGIYLSPSFGLTFGITKKIALDVAVAYVLSGVGCKESYDESYGTGISTIPAEYGFLQDSYQTTVTSNGSTHVENSSSSVIHNLELRFGFQF